MQVQVSNQAELTALWPVIEKGLPLTIGGFTGRVMPTQLRGRPANGNGPAAVAGNATKISYVLTEAVKANPGATFSVIEKYVADHLPGTNTRNLQSTLARLKKTHAIRGKGGRGHMKYWPVPVAD